MARTKYLNNKDLLKQIALSKNSYCSYIDEKYATYDIILPSLDKINVRTVAQAKRNQAKRLANQNYIQAKSEGKKVQIEDSGRKGIFNSQPSLKRLEKTSI